MLASLSWACSVIRPNEARLASRCVAAVDGGVVVVVVVLVVMLVVDVVVAIMTACEAVEQPQPCALPLPPACAII